MLPVKVHKPNTPGSRIIAPFKTKIIEKVHLDDLNVYLDTLDA